MLIVMKTGATEDEIAEVVRVVAEMNLQADALPGAQRTAIAVTGNTSPVDASRFEHLPGVAETIRVTRPLKLTTTTETSTAGKDLVVEAAGLIIADLRLPDPCARRRR